MRRRRRAGKLAAVQTPAVPTDWVQLGKPSTHFRPKAPNTLQFWTQFYLNGSTAGSEKNMGIIHKVHTDGRIDCSQHEPGRVPPHIHSQDRRGVDILPQSRSFALGPSLPDPFEIKPSHSCASLTMKKGGLSFSAAGGPTPRDDSSRPDRRETPFSGCEAPPLSL
ncbi:hypothetical protein AMECASPLE_001960 [Ameca splendens]|uniref:Uncharacterized protein n=1 Tax=Ameca splendens TaxID=208324 RepID=A0ABV1A4H0_9TELE